MKTALVTGAGRGLGKGFVEYLLEKGALVFAGVKNLSTHKLKKHKNLRVISLDVLSDKSIETAVKIIAEEVNHLTYLINNAGINKDTATNGHKEIVCELSKLDRKTLLKMFDVNTISPMMVLKVCLPLLANTESFVINISSNRASFADKNDNGNYGYRASKMALNIMTLSSLFDLPANVKTFAVHPGNVKTDMNPEGDQSPYDQATKIMKILEDWKDGSNGKFLRYDGTQYQM